jgi:Flavin containing amine oxidoreductase
VPGGRRSTLARAMRERAEFEAPAVPGGRTPEGRVHFAGEHTSTYSQGFLNGGVEPGQRAAIEVLRALGLPVPSGIASLPYSRIPGEHIGVGDRW